MNGRLFSRTSSFVVVAVSTLWAGSAFAQVAPGLAADPALPPIESIGAGSDVRSFLDAGVPVELTRAALRRAWVADPKIHDFRNPSEDTSAFDDVPRETQLSRAAPQ